MARKGMGLLLAGGAALLLMGGGKKKKKKSGAGNGNGYGGDGLLDPDGKKSGGSGSGSGSSGKKSGTGKKSDGSYNIPNLAPDAIWVSPDCKRVFFAEGRIGEEGAGSNWLENKAITVIRRFVDANYSDPYEISRAMSLSMAPCVAEFPVRSDGVSDFEIQAGRDYFLDTYRDVYALIMLLTEKAQSELDQDGEMISFNDNCDVTFVGNQWEEDVAKPMIDFYIRRILDSNPPGPGSLSQQDSKYFDMIMDTAPKVVERFNPTCGSKLLSLPKNGREPFLKSRPGLAAIVNNLSFIVSESFYSMTD